MLEFFHEHPRDHFSAEQVYKLLNEDMRNMSLATVYRVLGQLVDADLLSGVAFGEGRMVYELNDGTRHDHLVCTVCGRIYEFFDPEIEARQQSVANSLDFTVTGCQLVLFGICTECTKSGAQPGAAIRR